MTKIYREEAGYMDLLRDIMEHGVDTPDRTGQGRRKLFGQVLHFDLRTGFPLFSARSTPLRLAHAEFWAFLNGICHIGPHLQERGINIWDAHTSRDFLDSRKLWYLPEGHLGKGYGFQFRAFGGEYDFRQNPSGGVDQIKELYESLKNDRYGSRHNVTILNPKQKDEMALHPCWHSHQFLVMPGKDGEKDVLNLRVDSRSSDLLFGGPFNISQYSLYLLAFAKLFDMQAGELVCYLTDVHAYSNQFTYIRELLTREFSPEKPTVLIHKEMNKLEDLLDLEYDDLQIMGHQLNTASMITPKPEIAV